MVIALVRLARRRHTGIILALSILIVIVITTTVLLTKSWRFGHWWRSPDGVIQLNRFPPELRAIILEQMQASKWFDDDYSDKSFPLPHGMIGNLDPTGNCQLSPFHFNKPGEVEIAKAFTLDVNTTSCQAKLVSTTLPMDKEYWLSPMYDQMAPKTDQLSKCKDKLIHGQTYGMLQTQGDIMVFPTVSPSLAAPGRCPTVKGRRVLINYAGRSCCKQSQPRNCQTGLQTGGFDVCISFFDKSIDADFATKNCRIFRRARGAGLWLWKPYVIYRTLLALNDGDILFYSDSGSEFIANIDTSIICQQAKLNHDIVVFTVGLPESNYTKEEAFVLMGCTSEECRLTPQRLASFILFRKSAKSLRFVSEWLTYAQDWRILTNLPTNMFPSSQVSGGEVQHRHDQSILSLLAKKWALPQWPEPSQWGNKPNDPLTQTLKSKDEFKFMQGVHFIYHSRNKS